MNLAVIFILVAPLIWSHNLIHGQTWESDLTEAKIIAKKLDRDILLVFQGSDWCVPCIKLDREVWSTTEFEKHADKHYVLVLADFPRKRKNALSLTQTKTNGALAEKYNPSGIFPLVVKLTPEGKVKGKVGYERKDVTDYISLLDNI